jgi:hypothetical protein
MHADQFAIRLARVRHPFAATLEGKIKDAVVSPDPHGSRPRRSYHTYLELLSPLARYLRHWTNGRPCRTGEAARAAEGYFLQAHREQRELTEREVISLKKALERLRGLPPRRYPIDVSTRGIGLDLKSLGAAFPSA